MMKQTINAGILTVGLAMSLCCQADANMELEDACYGDVDIAEFVSQAAKSNAAPSSDYLNQDEVDQVKAILNDEAVVGLSPKEKFSAVMSACTEGRIFQERNSSIISQ